MKNRQKIIEVELRPEVLREARESRGLTLEATSEKIGVKRQTLHNYESGYALPSANVLLRLILFYELSAERLAGVR